MNVSQASVSSIVCHSGCLLPGTQGLLSLSPGAAQYSVWSIVGAQEIDDLIRVEEEEEAGYEKGKGGTETQEEEKD